MCSSDLERDPAFFRPFALDREDAALAVEIREAQPAELRDADAGVVEHPEDGSVAHRGPFGDRSGFVGRGAGEQEPFEFLGVDGLDERLADFGEHDPVKGVALEHFAMHQPVEEGARGAGVGLDGALTTRLAAAPRARAHIGEPAADSGRVDLIHQSDAVLPLQVRPQEPQGGAVPLQGLFAVVSSRVILQVVLDRARDGRTGAAGRLQARLFLSPPGLAGGCCCLFSGLLRAHLGLRVELVALRAGAVAGDVLATSEGGLADFLRCRCVFRLFLVHG